MNRRGFISLLAGAAGASFVSWRAHVDRLIVLPPQPRIITAVGGIPPYTYRWEWQANDSDRLLISTEAAARLPTGYTEIIIADSQGRITRTGVHVSVSTVL